MPIALQRAERADSCRARSVTERMVDIEPGERTGSRPSAAEGGGAPAPALRPADPRSSSSAQLLSPQKGGERLRDVVSRETTRPSQPASVLRAADTPPKSPTPPVSGRRAGP